MQLRRIALAGALSSALVLASAAPAPAISPALLLPLPAPKPAASPTPSAPVPRGPRIYKLPFPGGQTFNVCQGNNHAGWTHVGLGAYAWDFCMPVGTPVTAARGGTVRSVRQDSNVGGWGPKFADDGNFVVVDHGDGTSGLYMHLMFNGARVKLGDRVQTGQLLAYSGNTGWTSAPHLHFMVEESSSDDYYTQSLPVLFQDVQTNGGLPLEDQDYTSGNLAIDPRLFSPTGPPPFVPYWIQSFRATTLWSGPDDKAVRFGPAGQWQYFQVTAPQSGSRLQVTVAATGLPAFVSAADVGPSGPPPNTPPGAAALAPAAASVPSGDTAAISSQQVVVGPGDTLSSIARAHQLGVDQLVGANHLPDPNRLTLGQILLLPGAPASAPSGAAAPAASAAPLPPAPVALSVTVSSGDTLSSLAAANHTTVAKLIAVNQLGDPDQIQVGQVLKLA